MEEFNDIPLSARSTATTFPFISAESAILSNSGCVVSFQLITLAENRRRKKKRGGNQKVR